MIRSFARGVLIGTACICLLALGWLFLFRPSLAQYEASELKEAFTESDPGGNSGVLSLPWFNAENEKQLDLASLQAQYPDVQAWLSIPGTRVDYPVLQSSMENPEYYLRRNYKGEWRTAGSLFLQSDCRLSGKTLIVYAHNMNDGSIRTRRERLFKTRSARKFVPTGKNSFWACPCGSSSVPVWQ